MISSPSGGPINYAGLRDEVLRRLRNQILSGQLGDGDRIIERDVAQEMGISRGPVREALRQLEHEGLVGWLPRRGARVATITREDAEEFSAIRMAVEPVAVEFFLNRKNAQAFFTLDDCMRRLQVAADAGDWPDVTLLHMEFHSLVYTLSGRKRLQRVWEMLRIPLVQTFRLHPPLVHSIGELPTMHYELLNALKKGPVGAAKRATRDHIQQFDQALLRSLPTDADLMNTPASPGRVARKT